MTNTQGYPNLASYERLRRSARDLIDHGVAPNHRGGSLSVDALQLLYQRASSPESAADAIRLLHELQTYQVELDLLYEQLQANEQEIGEELAHYRSLYEQAPAAYLIVANDGEIIEGNRAAGDLFGEPCDRLSGRSLYTLLALDQQDTVKALLKYPEQVDQRAVESSIRLLDHRRVILTARPNPGGDNVLMILTAATIDPARR